MRLAAINVYPIKSLSGVSLKESVALKSGLELDRRWLLVDEVGEFISQRSLPKLATLSVEIDKEALIVRSKNEVDQYLEVPFLPNGDTIITCTIWDDVVDSIVYSKEINEWFSNYLEQEIRLVKMVDSSARKKDLGDKLYITELNYADGYPFLVLSKESVEEISREIGQDIDIRQFRANIIIEDCDAFAEDLMDQFQIGDAKFVMVKPSKRCQVIGINQDTGISSKEPIRYLAKHRMEDQHVIFGMNAALLEHGTIKVGEQIK